MYCPKCGTPNDDNAYKCVKCGNILQGHAPGPRTGGVSNVNVPNYLVQAILVTLFCCLPFGIVSIVYAAQVNGKLAGGDVEGAMQSSKNAKMWCWVAFGSGLVVGLLYFTLMMLGAVMSGIQQ